MEASSELWKELNNGTKKLLFVGLVRSMGIQQTQVNDAPSQEAAPATSSHPLQLDGRAASTAGP